MTKTTELRKQLKIILKTVASNVHYEDRPDDFSYPYVVYEASELTSEYGTTVMQLEVNVIDYGTDSTIVEELSDAIQEKLHKNYFINSKIQFATYKRNRNIIKEEDKKIMRRRMTFEIRLHQLKGE